MGAKLIFDGKEVDSEQIVRIIKEYNRKSFIHALKMYDEGVRLS